MSIKPYDGRMTKKENWLLLKDCAFDSWKFEEKFDGRELVLPLEKDQKCSVLNVEKIESHEMVQEIMTVVNSRYDSYREYENDEIFELYYGIIHPIIDIMYMMGFKNTVLLEKYKSEFFYCGVSHWHARKSYLEKLPKIMGVSRTVRGQYSYGGSLSVMLPLTYLSGPVKTPNPTDEFAFYELTYSVNMLLSTYLTVQPKVEYLKEENGGIVEAESPDIPYDPVTFEYNGPDTRIASYVDKRKDYVCKMIYIWKNEFPRCEVPQTLSYDSLVNQWKKLSDEPRRICYVLAMRDTITVVRAYVEARMYGDNYNPSEKYDLLLPFVYGELLGEYNVSGQSPLKAEDRASLSNGTAAKIGSRDSMMLGTSASGAHTLILEIYYDHVMNKVRFKSVIKTIPTQIVRCILFYAGPGVESRSFTEICEKVAKKVYMLEFSAKINWGGRETSMSLYSRVNAAWSLEEEKILTLRSMLYGQHYDCDPPKAELRPLRGIGTLACRPRYNSVVESLWKNTNALYNQYFPLDIDLWTAIDVEKFLEDYKKIVLGLSWYYGKAPLVLNSDTQEIDDYVRSDYRYLRESMCTCHEFLDKYREVIRKHRYRLLMFESGFRETPDGLWRKLKNNKT